MQCILSFQHSLPLVLSSDVIHITDSPCVVYTRFGSKRVTVCFSAYEINSSYTW